MHDDLRRRALESGKTPSNKAKSKQSSRNSSRPNSKPGSRVVSRDVSDDEDGLGHLSDDTNYSIDSIDALLDADDVNEQATDLHKAELENCITELLERKGSNKQGREDALTTYVRILTAHYIADVLYGRVSDLLDVFSRSVKTEATQNEAILAIRAIAVTAVTFNDETLYETVGPLLKRTITDSQSNHIKATAIHTLAVCLSFGGAGEDEITETLTFLLEIVSSDGAFIDADDDVEVVLAALQTYGFLATQVEDLEGESEDAITAILDQLNSDDVHVLIAAGENIALLYEKSYTPMEEDEELDDSEDEVGSDQETLVKRYSAYHNTHEVMQRVASLASLSAKAMGRRDKRNLHQQFSSIAITVENPRLGLQTHSASKTLVRIHRTGGMRVDTWWKLARLNAIKRLLGGGFVNHYYEGNKQVLDILPIIISEVQEQGVVSPKKLPSKASKGKYRDSRRFVSGEVE